MFILYKQLLYYKHDNFLRLRFLWVNCQVCSTLAIWRGAVHTDAIICVSPPVQDSFALFYQRGKNFSWLYKDIDSGYTVSVNQDWFSMPRFAHQALSCFVSRNKCFLCPDVLFKTMDHQCTWPPYCTHCLCASLFLCISACPCVFVSLYLSVIVFVFLFLCVSEQHLVRIPSIVILSYSFFFLVYFGLINKSLLVFFSKWNLSMEKKALPSLKNVDEMSFTDIKWWCASLISKMSWVRRRLRKPIALRLPGL